MEEHFYFLNINYERKILIVKLTQHQRNLTPTPESLIDWALEDLKSVVKVQMIRSVVK